MINVMLMMKDSTYWKELINNLVLKNENLRVCYIANTLKEFNFAICNYKIDIIIADVKESIFNKILKNESLNKKKFFNSVILINNEIKIDNSAKRYICGCVSKTENINKITTLINILINSKQILKSVEVDYSAEKRIKKRIKQELEYIGYNPLHFGTKYLIETIYILYTLEDYYDDNLERDIYPIVASKYGKTTHNIKCNIRNATDIMYYENDEKKIMQYLDKSNFQKPTTKEIITVVLNKII